MAEIEDIANLEIFDTEQLEQELARFRSGYYRDKFRLLAGITFFFALVNVVLVAVVFCLYLVQPKIPMDFYTSNLYNGKNTSIYPLDHSLVKPKKLVEWAQTSIVKSFNFNFVNYNDVFDNIKQYYTENGWNEYNNTLSKSGLLDNVINSKFFLSTIAPSSAIILEDGVVNGHYAWRVRMPIILIFKASENAAGPHVEQKITVDAIITRVPDVENPESVNVDSLNISWQK
jgi:intracellular multiplication protein IcmL